MAIREANLRGPVYDDDQEFSLFALGSTLLRNRWRIARWALLGALIAAVSVVRKPALYAGSASFVPQGGDVTRSGLASLAGQFGVSVPGTGSTQSPEFYVRLLSSRVVLEPIARDTFVVAEFGDRRLSLLDVFGIEARSPKRRVELGVDKLRSVIKPETNKADGSVNILVRTRWPSVSLAIVSALINGVNAFNEKTRQGEATTERRFVEGRVAAADSELRGAENRLEQFRLANREYQSAPQLVSALERIQRDVSIKQQVYTTLMQSLEEVRIREVRDTPLITILEPPGVPSIPEPRGRVRTTMLGAFFGAFVGSLIVLVGEIMRRRRNAGSVEAADFANAVSEVKSEVLRFVGRRTSAS